MSKKGQKKKPGPASAIFIWRQTACASATQPRGKTLAGMLRERIKAHNLSGESSWGKAEKILQRSFRDTTVSDKRSIAGRDHCGGSSGKGKKSYGNRAVHQQKVQVPCESQGKRRSDQSSPFNRGACAALATIRVVAPESLPIERNHGSARHNREKVEKEEPETVTKHRIKGNPHGEYITPKNPWRKNCYKKKEEQYQRQAQIRELLA